MDDNRRQKKRKSSHNNKIRRILRIRYTDPDATESSSDENLQKPKKIKRFVRDIPLPHINIDETSNESCEYLNKDNKVDVRRQPATNKYKGVRMRKWGSWASEIRNPMLKSGREWIGTFSTAEEASQAYQKRSLEIKEEMANAEKMKNSGNSENNNNVNNIIMATNQEKSNSAYFVSADSLYDSKSNTMFHTPSSLLPELDTPDCNLIDVGNVSSNEAKVDVLGGGFAKLDGPDLSVFNMQPLSLPPLPLPPAFVRTPNPRWFEDINICSIDDKDPCGIPSFNFADFGADDITYGIENPLFL